MVVLPGWPGGWQGQKAEAGPSSHSGQHQTQCSRILLTPVEKSWRKKGGQAFLFWTFLDFFLTLLSGSSGSLSSRLLSLRSPPRLWLLCTSTCHCWLLMWFLKGGFLTFQSRLLCTSHPAALFHPAIEKSQLFAFWNHSAKGNSEKESKQAKFEVHNMKVQSNLPV